MDAETQRYDHIRESEPKKDEERNFSQKQKKINLFEKHFYLSRE